MGLWEGGGGRTIQGKEAPKVMVALNAFGKLIASLLWLQFNVFYFFTITFKIILFIRGYYK